MPNKLHKISFVSGKGGVGKTSLAVNFAWICRHFAKTLLVDLDFQNQGATGLLSSFITPDCGSAIDSILRPESLEQCGPVDLDANLQFLPAVPLHAPPKHSELFGLCQQPEFEVKLENFLNRIHRNYNFEIVILDCHGGLDMVSVAAHRLSDHTLVVSEADRVTFNGTLELLDFYQAVHAARTTAAFTVTHSSGALAVAPAPIETSKPVELVINRIPPKYRWDDLNRVYEKVVSDYSTELNIASQVLAYIPSEDFAMESFGEIPFLVKVAPNSIVSQKLHLLAYKLFAADFQFPDRYKPLARLNSARRRHNLERRLESAESRNIKAIIVTFAFCTNGYVLVLLAFFLHHFFAGLFGATTRYLDYATRYAEKFFVLYFAVVSVFVFRAVLGLSSYYKDKYRVQRNILRASKTRPSLWQRISMFKLLILRMVTFLVPYIVGLTVIGILWSVVVSLRAPG